MGSGPILAAVAPFGNHNRSGGVLECLPSVFQQESVGCGPATRGATGAGIMTADEPRILTWEGERFPPARAWGGFECGIVESAPEPRRIWRQARTPCAQKPTTRASCSDRRRS